MRNKPFLIVVALLLGTLSLIGCQNAAPPSAQPATAADELRQFGNDYAALVDGLTIAHELGGIKDKQWTDVLKYEAVVDGIYSRASTIAAAGGDPFSVQNVLSQAADALAALRTAKASAP